MTAADSTRAEKSARVLETDHLMADLGRRTATGGAIGIAAQTLKLATLLAGYAVLARILVPEDFGLVAMAMAVTVFVGLFTDLGLSAATVQRKEIDQDTVSALFFVNLAVGMLVMLVAWLAAPVAAWFFGDKRVLWVVSALAATLPLTAAAAQHNALLQRGMRWFTIHWIGLAAQLLGVGVAILIAWRTDLGYWALVAQAWMSATVALILAWLACPWRPTFVKTLANARSAIHFGLNLTAFNVMNYFHRQLDDVLIGWKWGAAELGFYAPAYNLLQLPLSLINGPIGSAVVPALSRLQAEPERWRRSFLDAMTIVTFIGSGVAAIVFATAEPLVAVLYGPGWDKAGKILGFLAISMFAAGPMNALGWIYVSLGRTKRMFRWSLISTPSVVLSLIVGLPFGSDGLALSYSIAVCLLFVPAIFFAASGTPVTAFQLLRVTIPFMISAILSVALGLAASRSILTAPSDLSQLLMTGAFVALAYLLLSMAILTLDPEFKMLKSRVRSRWQPLEQAE